MRRILLGLSVCAVLLCFASAAQAVNPVTITPLADRAPTYVGANGTGVWYVDYRVTTRSDIHNYRFEMYDYIWTAASGPVTAYTDDNNDVVFGNDITATHHKAVWNQPSPFCWYPGFNWFGAQFYYRYQVQDPNTHAWGPWIGWIWSAVGPGVYAQVCL